MLDYYSMISYFVISALLKIPADYYKFYFYKFKRSIKNKRN